MNYFEDFVHMLLDIKGVPEGHSALSQTVQIDGDTAQGLVFIQGVDCRAEIDRIQTQTHILLFYNTVVQVECSRCLSAVNFPVKGEVRIVLQERSPLQPGDADQDDVDLFYDESTDEVDISSIIYDEVMISLPMKPLCSEQCKGIVTEKGAMVEREDIHSDPRWEALKKLKSKK